MEETITILKVGTQEAVQSIADLRENVKTLKKTLEETQVDTEEGWKQYQDTLELLKVNQNALKDAMYATTGTFEDVTKAATGASESYNSLVHRMAALKEEFRATNDAARRSVLGDQIKAVNDQLKELDKMQGNFQRNVGNYESALKGLGDHIDAFRKGLGAANGGLKGMKDGVEALQKSPAIATFTILVSLVMKLADAVKDDAKATAALKKGMEALQPVMDFLSGILDKIVDFLVEIIEKVTQFVTTNGIINKVIQGIVGIGNAIAKFILSPYKAIAAAIGVFKDEGIKGIRNATKAFQNELDKGVAFKTNFQSGQKAADAMLEGMSSRKKKGQDKAKKLGEDAAKKFAEGLYNKALDMLKGSERLDAAWRDALKTWEQALNEAGKEFQQEMQDDIDSEFEANLQSLQEWVKAEEEARKKDLEDAKAKAKAKKDLLKGVASATSDILGAIADLYETDSENAEKNANKIKNLRIAAATVDTISGAIGAFMQATETVPPPYGQILGAIEAAAITATGIANIAKIKATKVSTSGGASATPSISATASAPTLQTNVSNVRTITSASEEDRLNQMARDQRVYILASDIQASQEQIKTQVSESSF